MSLHQFLIDKGYPIADADAIQEIAKLSAQAGYLAMLRECENAPEDMQRDVLGLAGLLLDGLLSAHWDKVGMADIAGSAHGEPKGI